MENQSRELPEEIIQNIQSFLKTKEATQTILISKSWLSAWSSRPCLRFTLDDLPGSYHSNSVNNLIDRTLKSYIDRGIPIVKFKLSNLGLVFSNPTVEERWLKMVRQSNVIELDLALICNWITSVFQEIFLIKSLQVLRLAYQGGGGPAEFDLSNKDIKCLILKKLKLRYLKIDELTFHRLMSSCPLIEKLVLRDCPFIAHKKNNSFRFSSEFRSLKRLVLYRTQIYDELLQTFLTNSPILEELRLDFCDTLAKPINLSSVTLKRLYVHNISIQIVLIDVPNLHKIKCLSSLFGKHTFPFIITRPITKEMVKVTIAYLNGEIDESWFYGLREFLMKFAISNVMLSMYSGQFVNVFEEFRSTPISLLHNVETLKFRGYQGPKLLYSLFAICHPKIVTFTHRDAMYLHRLVAKISKDFAFYKGNPECCNSDQNKCWRHYIKDAKLYCLVDNEMKPLDINGLKTQLGHVDMISLALEWMSD